MATTPIYNQRVSLKDTTPAQRRALVELLEEHDERISPDLDLEFFFSSTEYFNIFSLKTYLDGKWDTAERYESDISYKDFMQMYTTKPSLPNLY